MTKEGMPETWDELKQIPESNEFLGLSEDSIAYVEDPDGLCWTVGFNPKGQVRKRRISRMYF